jgi:hypothetical protein
VGVLTGREELAEDLLDHLEVVDVVPGDGGERLVELQHALHGPVAVHQAGAEVGERDELEVDVADAPGGGEGFVESLL